MKNFVILYGFLAFQVISDSVQLSCPVSEDLTPCICKRLPYGLYVMCADFRDNSDLIRAFKVLRGYKVQNLVIHGLHMTETLPNDLFDGLEINELRVEDSSLMFSRPAFTGLDNSLYHLIIANTLIKDSKAFSLAHLSKLKNIFLRYSPLEKVRNDWLNGKTPNIELIVLDENEIDEIEDNAFQNLTKIRSLFMANNRIRTVTRSMLPQPAMFLRMIDFSGNEIKALPYDFFIDMPGLEHVILSENQLQTLPEKTWISIWQQLSTVEIFENELLCDEQLNWMKNVRWPNRVIGQCVSPDHLAGKSLSEVYLVSKSILFTNNFSSTYLMPISRE